MLRLGSKVVATTSQSGSPWDDPSIEISALVGSAVKSEKAPGPLGNEASLPSRHQERRVLVTGSSGFIGSPLCELLLADGHRVWEMNRGGSSANVRPDGLDGITYQSVGDQLPSELLAWGPETVVNLAWSGIPDYGQACSVANLEEQIRLFEQVVAIESVERVVGAGTCLEYGARGGLCEEDETAELDSFLAWSKRSLRNYLLLATSTSQIDVVWFRIFYAYGPRQRCEGLLPSMLAEAASGRQFPLINPDGAKDFVYIDDVVEAFRRAVNPDSPSGTFNVGSGFLVSLRDVWDAAVRSVEGRTDEEAMFTPVSAEASDSEIYASLERVSQSFGWHPRVPLEEGIRRTWWAMNDAGLQLHDKDFSDE